MSRTPEGLDPGLQTREVVFEADVSLVTPSTTASTWSPAVRNDRTGEFVRISAAFAVAASRSIRISRRVSSHASAA